MNRDQKIYEKINNAIRLLCDVYEILNEKQEILIPNVTSRNYLGVTQFSEKYPEYTKPRLRHFINVNKDGFNEMVTKRIGKKILINEDRFFEWIERDE